MTPEQLAYDHGFLAGMWYAAENRAVNGAEWDHRPFLAPRDPAALTLSFGQALRNLVALHAIVLRLAPDRDPPDSLQDALVACARVVQEPDPHRADLLKSVVEAKIDQMGAELRDMGIETKSEPGNTKPLPTDAEFGRGFCDGVRQWCLQFLSE
jgi:hypothetical protein